jgi:serine protease
MRFRTLAVLAGLVLVVGERASPPQAAADIQPAPGTRLVTGAGPPAIDGGLRDEALAIGTPAAGVVVADTGLSYIPGRVIVKFRAGAGSPAFSSLTRQFGGRVVQDLPYANFQILEIPADADPEAVARELSERSDVEYAQADYLAHFLTTPNDPLYAQQWSYPALDMERAWDINPGATRDVIVAVLDSGIAFENTVIRYNTRPFTVMFPDGSIQRFDYGVLDVPYAAATDLVAPDRIVAPYDFTWNDPHPVDTLGHGTHVAGTIGQLTNNNAGCVGMAYNVRLMPVKVAAGGNWDIIFGAPSPGFSDDQVARAIRYAADNGAKAMNMSFGRSGAPAPVVEDAVRYAVSKGAFCVFAAGNGGLAGSPIERYAEIGPKVEGAVAVGAVGPSLNRAIYSSTGSWVELSAPGGDTSVQGVTGAILQQTLNGLLFASPLVRPRFDGVVYGYAQGTSMAAPHVTGFAALLYQQGITSPAAIEAAMKKYATDRGPAGRDNEYGAGVINPRATLRGLGLGK